MALGFQFWVPPTQIEIPPNAVVKEIPVTLGGPEEENFFYSQFENLPDDLKGSKTGKPFVLKYIVQLTEEWQKYNTVLHIGVRSYIALGSSIFAKTSGLAFKTSNVSIQTALLAKKPIYEVYVGYLDLKTMPGVLRVAFG